MNHDQYVDLLKSHLKKTILKNLTSWIISKLPFLGWGIFSPVLSYVMGKIIDYILDETELAVFMKYIDVRTDSQGRKFYDAIENNQNAQLTGSEDDKKKAEEELINTFRDFVKFSN